MHVFTLFPLSPEIVRKQGEAGEQEFQDSLEHGFPEVGMGHIYIRKPSLLYKKTCNFQPRFNWCWDSSKFPGTVGAGDGHATCCPVKGSSKKTIYAWRPTKSTNISNLWNHPCETFSHDHLLHRLGRHGRSWWLCLHHYIASSLKWI